MGQINDPINPKNSMLLSRNKPVALVVGANSFLGSFLIDKLLEKEIQVIGIDELEALQKKNLLSASGNKNFHLILESLEKIELDIERLDYIFLVSLEKEEFDNILQLFKKFKSRVLLISSIDLYEETNDEKLKKLKSAESKIAKFAKDFNLNARVLRLGAVFGPRMEFSTKEPLIKLIQQALTENLQKDVSLEFSSRALYIDDAVDLMIRTIFAGSTSQKIFDGVNIEPVKVSEIKQVLLDPIWYESRNFTPSPLPPWATPNLEKTVNFLNWYPKAKLVFGLKQTLSYFKDNEIAVPRLETLEIKLDKSKKEELEQFKKINKLEPLRPLLRQDKKLMKIKQGSSIFRFIPKIYLSLVIALICFALIWPAIVLIGGAITFRYQFDEGVKNLQKGEFEKSLSSLRQAEEAAADFKIFLKTLEPVRKTGIGANEFAAGEQLTNAAYLSVSSVKSTAAGMQALMKSIKAVTGELNDSPKDYFYLAQLELTAASNNLSKTQAILKDGEFNKKLPGFLSKVTKSYLRKLNESASLVNKAQALSVILPKITALYDKKDYLILLQNNMELRPTGGFIGSFAKVSFEGGKLKKLAVDDIYAIDGNLKIHVEPPKEIKEDLNQKDWFLRDSNWEPDFPTSARWAEWFFAKETGSRVEGVVALDISAMEEFLGATGPLNLPDYGENITAENLFEKAVTQAESNFFPGSQAKKSFLTALSNGVFNKIFFLPQNNWLTIVAALGRSLEQKHISIYLNDPKLFSFILSQNWAHILPRAAAENSSRDFLSLVESNLGANKANYYLSRSYHLQTMIGKDGEVKHRLRINYTNSSPSETFPGGKYKNRMRIYLPFGSKITKVLWGESEITKNVTGFVDYGRSGYSLLLELDPKEQKILVLDYNTPLKLEFNNNKATYRLDIIKQAGTLKDPLEWTITYPISFKLASDQTKMIGPQEQTIQTDLSVDRSLEIEFTK